MELKHGNREKKWSCNNLLIVPYGIETVLFHGCIQGCKLLIVPYGIETFKSDKEIKRSVLLIVPYGIETV